MSVWKTLLVWIVLLAGFGSIPIETSASKLQQQVFDEAGLLQPGERSELEELANQFRNERQTDFLIYTTLNAAGEDVKKLTQKFYDDKAPGYDRPHGNAVILTLDMKGRELYLAGFYKGKEYLDDQRLDRIRDRITPYLKEGDYRAAFGLYLETAHRFMDYPPGVDPDFILFNGWVQVALSAVIAALVVGLMAYRSGGRVTVSRRTYEDTANSGILEHRDQYLRTTTTKTKIERNKSGGGGGTTGGGHSHSGSRGSF